MPKRGRSYCTEEGCLRFSVARGLCNRHYCQARKEGRFGPSAATVLPPPPETVSQAPGVQGAAPPVADDPVPEPPELYAVPVTWTLLD